MKTTLKSIIIIFIILFSLSLLTSISYADSAMQYFSREKDRVLTERQGLIRQKNSMRNLLSCAAAMM